VGGMGALVDALAASAVERGTEVRSAWPIESLDSLGDYDGVVLAVPAPSAARLVAGASPEAAALLGAIRYASVLMVTVSVPAVAVAHPLDGSGCIVPSTEPLAITAVSWATSKWTHLGAADPSTVVFRVSLGRFGDEGPMHWDEDSLRATVRADLAETVGLTAAPLDWRVTRWPDALPQYTPGHLDRVAAVEADLLDNLPTVAVAGAAYRGLGVPACLRQGREAARGLLDRLGS
jgi:protoporphyrinogen/coproporphyrinogen III oxidase